MGLEELKFNKLVSVLQNSCGVMDALVAKNKMDSSSKGNDMIGNVIWR